jgi:hypothetical protein
MYEKLLYCLDNVITLVIGPVVGAVIPWIVSFPDRLMEEVKVSVLPLIVKCAPLS